MNTSTLQEFQYQGTPIQVLGDPNQPLFIAKEVCNALGLSDVYRATERLDDDEKLTRKLFVSGQNRDMTVINEPGLYNLVLRSTKPEAKTFKRWVTHEVLPAIRRKGYYLPPEIVKERLRKQMARERLAEYIHYSDIWDEDKVRRLVELKESSVNSNRELAKIFDCSHRTVIRVYRMYRHTIGDFDKSPQKQVAPPLNLPESSREKRALSAEVNR